MQNSIEKTWTIYPDVIAAITANAQAALAAGCNMQSSIELNRRVIHPADGRSAVQDNVGDCTTEQLIGDGWFNRVDDE